ncbi:tRNA (adenosine(37)-N6)-dimethylallyltransferase MiaA [Candidatus Nomurabacteria bacterium]|nr:tRNA (adenosine(37)-N6)-dimethylallyltransferase MiaA [Candidatus Nomurabacteria bacterium]
MQKIIAIVGPTASGKSGLGIYLAQKLRGEVISADSRQVYKGLDIGTGKVTKKEMQGVRHHLLDTTSPKRQFSVDDFVKKAERTITAIHRNGGTPIVVGGTGLYVDMLLGRMSYAEVPPNPALRAKLELLSTDTLFARLQKLDPRRATTIEPHHKRRLIRAIEIATAIGKNPAPQTVQKYEVLWLGLNPADLPTRISARLRARLKQGMIAEAKRLHTKGLSYKRMDELGLEYRYLAKLLQKKITRDQFEQELERAINQYAKRQWRWFKRNKDIAWIGSKTEALRLAKAFLSR